MRWQEDYRAKVTTCSDALNAVRGARRVFMGANCGEPETLAVALTAMAPELDRVEVLQLLDLRDGVGAGRARARHLRYNALFIGPGVRDAVNEGWADYTPVFLSEIPALLRGPLAPDVALIHVGPPDAHGYCSYGVSVDIAKAGAERAPIVIAEVNAQMPRTLGDSFVHVGRLTHVVETDRPVRELPVVPFSAVHERIGRNVAELVEDGATLQLGVGAIPNAVLGALEGKRRLGLHTEMFSDGVMDAYESGLITNEAKTLHPGKMVTSFVMGSRRLYDFVDNNPVVEMHPSDYTNDPFVIAANDRLVAINSAISVDLTGQVNADSIGLRLYSGIGGQVDFIRGAARSRGGKPIIALPSTARGASRIVPTLAPGAGVVTSRGDVHYVVTEHGVAYLHGRTIRDRARALIDIAHPDHREALSRFAREQRYLAPHDGP